MFDCWSHLLRPHSLSFFPVYLILLLNRRSLLLSRPITALSTPLIKAETASQTFSFLPGMAFLNSGDNKCQKYVSLGNLIKSARTRSVLLLIIFLDSGLHLPSPRFLSPHFFFLLIVFAPRILSTISFYQRSQVRSFQGCGVDTFL